MGDLETGAVDGGGSFLPLFCSNACLLGGSERISAIDQYLCCTWGTTQMPEHKQKSKHSTCGAGVETEVCWIGLGMVASI